MTRIHSIVSALALLSLTLMVSYTNANVIGFDFGSTYYKITVVQPGKGFEIVENDTSLRKTEGQFTITQEKRLYGKDSFAGNSRYPKTTFADLASFLGQEYDAEKLEGMRLNEFVMNDFVEDERGLVAWQSFSLDKKKASSDDEQEQMTTYFTEELLSQLFKHGKNLSERTAGGVVKEAVVTVPSYFTQEQRLMLIDAAELSGLSVNQLVHENTAAATMYAVDNRAVSKEALDDQTILFYNMGGRDTEVAIVKFSQITNAKNKTFESIEVIGEGWDSSLGGKAFDHVIVQILVEEFNAMKEREGKPDVRENIKAMKRLYKETSKIKEILSANKVVDVKIPELLDYVTLKFKLERTRFEQQADNLFQRVADPINQAIKQAKISVEDLTGIEILGGGVRVPKVQEIIKQITGREELSVHLNGDEAMCFGSAYIASNFTSSFKVRHFYLTQHPKYDIKINLSPLSGEAPVLDQVDESTTNEVTDDAESSESGDSSESAERADTEATDMINYYREVTLFTRDHYLGQRKTMNVVYDKAMKIDATALYYDDDGNITKEESLVSFELPKLDEIAEYDVVKKEGTTKPKVSLQFELSRSQLLKLVSAKVGVEETVFEEIIPEVKEDEKDEKDEDKKEDENEDGDYESTEDSPAEDSEQTDSTEENQDGEKAEEEEKPKEYKEIKVPHSYPLEPTVKYVGARILSEDQVKEAKKRIKALDKRDENKKLTDEAKNSYEELIYEMRGWLNEDDNEPFVKEEDKESLLSKLEEAEDWLYGDGSDMGYKEYQTKTYELTTEFTPLKKRQKEHELRGEYVEGLLEYLKDMKTKALEIRETMPWVTEGEQDDLTSKIQEIIDFIEDKMQEQSAADLSDEPVFTMDEVETKMKKLETLQKKIFGKKKPREPKKPKEKKTQEEKKEESTDEEEKKQDDQEENTDSTQDSEDQTTENTEDEKKKEDEKAKEEEKNEDL